MVLSPDAGVSSPVEATVPSLPRHAHGWSLEERDPRVIESFLPFWQWCYDYYFRATTDGWEHIPAQGQVLLVGSHNGGFAAPDTFMFAYEWFRRFGVERPAYGLMHPVVWQLSPALSQLAAQLGAVVAHPKMAIAALEREAAVLVYPGGAEDLYKPYLWRHRIHFVGRKGFIKLALRQQVPIIPVISRGAHETLLILGDCYPQLQQLHRWGLPWPLNLDPIVFPIYLGLPWGLGIGPIPNIPFPVQIHVRICPPIVFEHYGQAASKDQAYVSACYETVVRTMQAELDSLVQVHQ